jgi:hypothetical protein
MDLKSACCLSSITQRLGCVGFSCLPDLVNVALKQLNDITERWRAALTRLLITVPCSNPTPADRLTDVVPKITSSP